jgi:recombination associated protein RdgC
MWFKNAVIYRVPNDWVANGDDLEQKLSLQPLQPCGGFQMESQGWTFPHEDGVFLYQQMGHYLINFGVEQKLLPSTVIRQHTKDRVAEIEKQIGHPLGRKQMRDLRDQVTTELLPRALSKRASMAAWIDVKNKFLVVDTGADKKSESLMEALRRADDTMQAKRIDTEMSPGSVMSQWLLSGDAPGVFTIDQDLELCSLDASRATVRYVRHSLEGKEIKDHILAGKKTLQLGLTWNDRISFILTDQLQIKRISFLNILKRESDAEIENYLEQFEMDFVLMTGELSLMIADLVSVLGGEKNQS